MPRFAANLSFLWADLPFLDRFAAAARAGFTAVEYHFPYEFAAADIKDRLQSHALTPVLHNIAVGNAAAGEFGLACVPGRESDFRAAVVQSIDYALALGTPQCNCLVGKVPAGADVRECERVLVSNLRIAAREFAKAGLRLMVEPLNNVDMPGFFLNTSAETIRILDLVGEENVMLQYDLYHMEIMGDDLAATLTRLLPRIGHIQFADVPGRHEPGTGKLDFAKLFAHIDAIGYRGWVSAEYRPSGDTENSLGWHDTHRSAH
jgi:hydroxypyruvate isomerase